MKQSRQNKEQDDTAQASAHSDRSFLLKLVLVKVILLLGAVAVATWLLMEKFGP